MSNATSSLEHVAKALPSYLAGRRWFRAKAQTISAVTIPNYIQLETFLVLLIRIEYAQGREDLYLLPVTSVTKPNAEESAEEPITTFLSPEFNTLAVYDSILSPSFRDLLFRTLTSGATVEGVGGSLKCHSLITPPRTEGIVQSFVSKAEQSNVSLIYGRDYILKLFRKIEPGINPDIEIGAFLTAQGFKNTPAVLATLDYVSTAGQTYSAGILQQFVPNQGDAWRYTLSSLAAFYPRALNSTAYSPELLDNYSASAALLGVRTAQMHAALASSSSSPDFSPEPCTAADTRILADEIFEQAQTTLQLLRATCDSLPFTEQQLALRVLEIEPRIIQRSSAISAIETNAKRIRHHGDYHLGQVLFTGTDFMIIDFEGEPARPLSERRSKALALRDLAGMLRSFQYAAFAALYGLVPGLPTDPESAEKIAACSSWWASQISRIYLDAYFREASDAPFLPSTPEQREFFLNAFLLQKALYEVQYELNNRPAWVGIPLRGILGLFGS